MQSLEITGMKEVEQVFKSLPAVVKRAKGEVFETIGQELLTDVQQRIGGSGRISGVQEFRVGSGKGYVAVRAMAKTDVPKAKGRKKAYPAGYVTNSLESGHVIANRYILSASRVPGKRMYEETQARHVGQVVEIAAKRIEQAILGEMGA